MLPAISDDEVICRVRNGDLRSYELLATRYRWPLHRVACRLLRSDPDAEDAVQGAHLLALTHIDQYRGAGYFPWMCSIVVNEALTQMRKRRRFVEIDDIKAERLLSRVRSPEQEAIEQNAENILEQAVQALPAAYQPVFRFREMQELTTAETGKRLGLSGACVKSRLFRAKKLLRKRLQHALEGAAGPAQALRLHFRTPELPGPVAVERAGCQC
jgi:RNA polymerase sigma-70 factor (ECF subfamily)